MTSYRNLRTPTVLAAWACLLAAWAVTPVTSARAETAKSVSVTTADLNLASDDGRAVLKRRIEQAAKLSCGGEPSPTIRLQPTYRDCIKAAMSGAAQHMQTAIAAASKETSVAQATN